MHLRGLRDIKTHRNLDRKRRLTRAAGNLNGAQSRPTRIFSPTIVSLHRELNLEKKIRLYQIEVIRDLLQEMQQAMAERIPGAVREFEWLTRRLKNLEAE